MNELIQWPRAQYWDKPWNPIVGCQPISPACENCYAKTLSARFGVADFTPHETSKAHPPTSKVVFCGNMTDLFGEWADEDYFDWRVEYIKRTLRYSHKATYLWLTKRVEAMCNALNNGRVFLKGEDDCDFPFRDCEMRNQFFGFTAETQEWYDKRIKEFRGDMPDWANGWLSAEPLLGHIDLGLRYIAPEDMPFQWVVVGCESGPNRRPCKIEWVESIVEQCRNARIPVFVKQLDTGGKCETDINKFPEHLRIRQVPWAKEGDAK